MTRALTILAAVVALAVSAAPASALPRPAAGFSIDIGTSEAAKQVTDGTSNTLQSKAGSNGIIAILIG